MAHPALEPYLSVAVLFYLFCDEVAPALVLLELADQERVALWGGSMDFGYAVPRALDWL